MFYVMKKVCRFKFKEVVLICSIKLLLLHFNFPTYPPPAVK